MTDQARSVDGASAPSATGTAVQVADEDNPVAVRNAEITKRMDKSIAAGMWDGGPFSADRDKREHFAENVKREVLIQVARRPELHECTMTSIADAARDAFYTGLMPDGREGYLVPFRVNVGTKSKPVYEARASFMPSWRGLQSAAVEDHEIDTMKAEVVRAGDHFDWTEGLNPKMDHTPTLNSNKPIVAAYAVAWRPGRAPVFVVVDRQGLDASRRASKNSGLWKGNEPAMARKTAIRRLCDRVVARPTARMLAVLRSGPPEGATDEPEPTRLQRALAEAPEAAPEPEPEDIEEAEFEVVADSDASTEEEEPATDARDPEASGPEKQEPPPPAEPEEAEPGERTPPHALHPQPKDSEATKPRKPTDADIEQIRREHNLDLEF